MADRWRTEPSIVTDPLSSIPMASATLVDVGRIGRRHVFHGVAFVVGLVALTFVIDQLGWGSITRAVVGTGSWFAVIAAIDLLSVLCDARGVYCILRPLAPIPYLRVFAAQASGVAINRLTPGNSIGEPLKVTMLMAHVPEEAAVSAIVTYNLVALCVSVSGIAVGVPLTLLTLDLAPRVELLVWIGTAVMIAFVLGLIVLVRRGGVATLITAGERIHLVATERATRWRERVVAIDDNLRKFGDAASRHAVIFAVASRILNWSGTLVVLHVSQVPLTPSLVIGMLSVGILITWMSNVIPFGLGLAEGGNYALYGALGSSPASGLHFTMINRVRTCVLAAMGLTVMAIANAVARSRRAVPQG